MAVGGGEREIPFDFFFIIFPSSSLFYTLFLDSDSSTTGNALSVMLEAIDHMEKLHGDKSEIVEQRASSSVPQPTSTICRALKF